jgi:predicted RNA methylase
MPNTIYDQQLKQYEIDKAEYDRIEKLHKEAAEISHKQKLEQKEREEFERLRKKFERK